MQYDLGGEYERLRSYQLSCVTSVFDSFNEGDKSTMMVLPTSAGKTVIFGAIIKRYLDRWPLKRVVVLSHLDVLTKQNEESIRDFWNIDTDILQAQQIPRRNAKCIISTMQSYKIEDKRNLWGMADKVGLIVIDEVQMYGSKTYDDIVESLPEGCLILGCTATPFRSNKDMTSMFDSVAYSVSLQELIDQKYIVPPILRYFKVEKGEDDFITFRNIIAIYKLRHEGEKSIVFLRTIKQCEQLANMFKVVGIKAKALTSKVTGQVRYDIIDDYKAGEDGSYDVLITVNVLTAGFSSNNVRSLFMPYQISSVAAYIQRIGRALRLDPDSDKTHADIYVGGEAPQLTKEKYERIQKKALTAGTKTQEEIELELEEYETTHDDDGVEFNAETIELMRDLKTTGFSEISKMIRTKDFPEELLGNLVDCKIVSPKHLKGRKPSRTECSFLKRHGIMPDGMSRVEAIYAVSSLLEKKGIDKADIYIQDGLHKGKPYQTVPEFTYKFISGKVKQAYQHHKYLYSQLDSL